MKIAMISEGWEPFVGGGQIYAKQLCEMLTKFHNCDIDVFTRKFIDENGTKITSNHIYSPTLQVLRVGPIGSFFSLYHRIAGLFNITVVLYKKSLHTKYNIIHAHATLPGIAAWIVGKLRKIPVLYTVHGTNQLDVGKKNIFYYMEKFLVVYMKYDAIVSVSHKIFLYNPRTKHISVVPPGIHVDYIAQKDNDTVKKSGKNYIFVGRFDPIKGLSNLVRAIGEIDEDVLQKNNFHLSFVGDGPIQGDIKTLLASVGREKYCSFLGKKGFDDVIHEYKKHTVFILPSLSEGQPIVVLEAMASKLPVIATDVGDNSYVITKDNGILVEPGNVDALKNAIEKTLSMDIDTLQQMGENAYTTVKDRFDWKTITSKIYVIYQETIGTFNQ